MSRRRSTTSQKAVEKHELSMMTAAPRRPTEQEGKDESADDGQVRRPGILSSMQGLRRIVPHFGVERPADNGTDANTGRIGDHDDAHHAAEPIRSDVVADECKAEGPDEGATAREVSGSNRPAHS